MNQAAIDDLYAQCVTGLGHYAPAGLLRLCDLSGCGGRARAAWTPGRPPDVVRGPRAARRGRERAASLFPLALAPGRDSPRPPVLFLSDHPANAVLLFFPPPRLAK